MYALREVYEERETCTEAEIYTERGIPARWPRLVREHAVDDWPESAGSHHADAGAEVGDAGSHHADAGEPEVDDPEDEIFLLGERCAEAYMQADALHYWAMKLLAEFDRREGWQDTGFSSTAEWLTWRIGIKPGAARERLRTALALEQLPEISGAMKNGELSFTKVRALTRVARPENENMLLDFARAGSAANLERVVRGWKRLDRKSEVTAEQIRHRSRRFSAWVDEDGMVVVKGRLDPEVGALFMRAVEAASDALFRETSGADQAAAASDAEANSTDTDSTGTDSATDSTGATTSDAATEAIRPEQRRADAVGLIAERALASGFGDGAVSGSRAERYQVMLHVDAETLEESGDPGLSELEDGTRVSAAMQSFA